MNLSIYMSKKMADKVKQIAKQDSRSVSGFVNLAVKKEISSFSNRAEGKQKSIKGEP